MQVSQIKTDDTTSAQYSVVVPAQDVAAAITEKLTKYGKDATIAGFRKGKAPLKILQKRYGDAALGEFVNTTVQKSVEDIAKQNDLKVALQPDVNIKSAAVGEALEFDVTYVLLPRIDLMDVSKLHLTIIKAKVDDSQIDDYIANMAQQSRESEPVNRKAKKGDAVVIDFDGAIDGVPFEGGSGSDHTLELGAGAFIPGFEDQLVGAKAGDSKQVTVTFPKDYQNVQLAGKQAVFACAVKQVKAFKQAVIDDEMAKKFGVKNLDALKQGVAQQLANQFANETRPLVKKDIMDALDDAHKFDIPQVMLNQEFEDMWKQIFKAKQDGQLDAEDATKTDDQLKQEYLAVADRRVRLGLVLTHIASQWGIEVSQDDVKQAVMQEAQRYPGQESQVFEYYQKNPQVLDRLRAPILEEKVIDAILQKAQVTEKHMTAEEIQAVLESEHETPTPAKPDEAEKPKVKKTAAKKAAAKKIAASKAPVKKTPTKKAAVKKTAVKKAVAKKATVKKVSAKKTAVKKASAKKSVAKKSTAKKA